NGAGKTTFLKLLAGDLKPDAGRWVIGETVKIGFYRQDGLSLKEDKRVIDVVRDIAEYLPLKKGMKLSAEQLLEHFMFPRPQQQVFASQLSGGEKRRLHLLQVLMSNPNFLILDEPTNDLDILTLNVLENYLSEFPGCLVVVTHDRYFLDKLVDHLFVFRGDGTVIDFNGTYSEFRAEQSQVLAPLPDPNTEKTVSQQAQRFQDTKEKKKQLKKVERSLEQLQQERQKILDWFAEGHTDIDESTRKNNRLQQLEAEVTQLEEEWLELASELEESSD
ncbi:MAG: ABC-F family ATP-binding cassette domain-containing protein, partial [Saprospiraceae bacterium]|nr:ABC-F family ATP-binding cassette domain-containing protein [Saprospiraceae bacterium]